MPNHQSVSLSQRYGKLFSLFTKQNLRQTDITMQLFTGQIYTDRMPQVSSLLNQFLPRIFEHSCYNDDNLTFAEEVKNTEIGHLFEHILLEYISQTKFNQAKKQVRFRGETYWDWNSEPMGTFHITISIGSAEAFVLKEALEKSVTLLQRIFEGNGIFAEDEVSVFTLLEREEELKAVTVLEKF